MREYIASLVQQTLIEYLNNRSSKASVLILLIGDAFNSNELKQRWNDLHNYFDVKIIASEQSLNNLPTLEKLVYLI